MNKLVINIYLKKSIIIILAFIQAIIFFKAFLSHKIFNEFDGVMHYISGLYFIENGIYKGWASHYWPPIQPLLLSFGDPFVTGKLVSTISGILTLFIVYKIATEKIKEKYLALLVVLIIFSSSYFLQIFIFVENHSLESMLFLLSVWMFFRANNKNSLITYFCSGLFCGLASLSRYTSISLFISISLLLFFRSKKNIRTLASFIIGFVMTSSSWWVLNYLTNGSPIHTWQYTNLGGKLHKGGMSEFQWIHQNYYDSILDVISAFPYELIVNFSKNLIFSSILIINNLSSFQILSYLIFFILLFFFLVKKDNIKQFFLANIETILISIFFIGMCSIAFVFSEALSPVIFLTIISIFTFFINKFKNSFYFIILIVLLNMFGSLNYIDKIIFEEKNDLELQELEIITEILNDNKKDGDLLMSPHPAHSYYSKMNWILTPSLDDLAINDLIHYNLPKKIIDWAPKNPVNLKDFSVDYIIDKNLNLNTNKCKLKVLYKSDKVSLYKVLHENNH